MKTKLFTAFIILTLTILFITACGNDGNTVTPDVTIPDLSEYVAVRSDYAGSDITAASIAMKKYFEASGMTLTLTTDWGTDSSTAPAKEIIIGKAERTEYTEFAEKLKSPETSAAYGMVGEKIILYANNAENLCDIVDKFANDVLSGGENISLTDGAVYEFTISEKLMRTDGENIMNTLSSSKLWGVNAHHKGYPAYPANLAEEHVRLAAEMGSTIYRINFNPVTNDDIAYISNIADLCHEYGMKIMLVLDRLSGTNEEIAERMTFAAENLADKMDYFQIFNETDIYCSKRDDGTFYNATNWTGMTTEYYNPERVEICIEKMRAALDAFRAAAPNAKLVVNIGSRHFPILDWYIEAGLSWDIIAYDIYDLNVWDHHAFFKQMEERYPGYDFMVAECNYPANSGEYTEEQQEEWLTSFLEIMDTYDSDRMLAVIIYELMDQPNIQETEKWSGEAHFGIVNTNSDYSIAEPKRSYRAVQKLLCGGETKFGKVFTSVE